MEYLWDPTVFSPEVHIAHYQNGSAPLVLAPRILEDFELVLVTHGRGRYAIPDRTIDYEAQSLIITPPYQRHAYLSLGGPVAHYAIHFDLSRGYSRQYRRGPEAWDEKAFLRYIDSRNGAQVEIPPYIPEVSDTFLKLFKEVIHRQEGLGRSQLSSVSLRLNSVMADLLALTIETCSGSRNRGRASQEERLSRAAYIMDTRYGEALRVSALAEAAGYADNYFSVEFARYYGLSPMEYLRERRILRAKELLRSTNLPIKEISGAVGFQDPLYFSKVFTKRNGISASRYRELAAPSADS